MASQHFRFPGARRFRHAVFRSACMAACCLACAAPAHADPGGQFYGLLRTRDLSPFGSLRLDMRPAHAVAIETGSFAFETELGYQNTWALSPEVERYLVEQEALGRREIGPADVAAIRALPGENYLVDLEAAVVDLTLHYKFSPRMSAYLIANAITFDGGFLDGTIESFHDNFGFDTFGRPAASRNDVNIIFDLKSSQFALFEEPTSGGFTDPTLGVRYTSIQLSEHWRMGVEAAVKIPVAGRRAWLSTGRTDYGAQLALQRRWVRNAFYANVAAVYYAGAPQPVPQEAHVIPTILLGHEFQWTQRTNIVLQAYVSDSPYTNRTTDLDELIGTKYQLTLGLRHMRGNLLYTFGFTENLQNVNNTPDIGVQFGVAFIPKLIRQSN
jgi:Protein of unknown function (DUF3187)